MTDLKKTFRKIVKEWGHDVILQRKLSNGNFSTKYEQYTTRHVGQTGTMNASSAEENIEGISYNYDIVYYFEAEVNPKIGDRIRESVGFSPSRNYGTYLIDGVTPVRGRMGKIVYWIVGATRER